MDEKLIAAVRRREPIWNPAHELRRNSQILKSLWQEVSEETGIDGRLARGRWKNLRAYYMFLTQDLIKQRSGSSVTTRNALTWKYYSQLTFLGEPTKTSDKSAECRPQITDVWVDSPTLSQFFKAFGSKDSIEDNERGQAIVEEDQSISDDKEDVNVKIEDDSFEEESSNMSETDNFGAPSSSKENRDVDAVLGKRKCEQGECSKRKIRFIERQEDSELLFFKSLIPYMQDFSSAKKLRVRQQIQDIILEEHEQASKANACN